MEMLSPGTPIDLSNCEREPIHIPGSIQPHGYTLAFDSDSRLTHVSANLIERFGLSPSDVLGQSSNSLPSPVSFVHQVMTGMKGHGSVTTVDVGGEPYIARHVPSPQGFHLIEFEKDIPDLDLSKLHIFEEGIQSISYSRDKINLLDTLVTLIEQLTDYDRVMAYRFDSDWNGEIVAEKRRSDLEPFLGLHYPASDIPPQARALYKVNHSRLIVDVNYKPVDLITYANTASLDLTYSRLRSISPMHIKYLQNMNVRATFVISILVDDELWGLVACHHYLGPKHLSIISKVKVETAVKIASLVIGAHRRLRIAQADKFHGAAILRLKNMGFMDHPDELGAKCSQDLLELTGASGAVLKTEGSLICYGKTPDLAAVSALIQWIQKTQSWNQVFHTDELSKLYAPADSHLEVMAGLMVVPFGGPYLIASEPGMLLFFRPEFVQTVQWAGNPDKSIEVVDNALSPRRSFALWKEVTAGTSRPWNDQEISAAQMLQLELVKHNMEILAQRRKDAERRLVRLGRMSAIGQLAAGIAHDFNNALQGIKILASKASTASTLETAASSASKINVFTDRSATLIQKLLQYSRTNPADHKEVDPFVLLEEAMFFAETLVSPNISVKLDAVPRKKGLKFWGSHDEILQCLVNLITNARDAMKDRGGQLTVKMTSRPASANEIKKYLLAEGIPYLFFEVSDEGTGITSENLSKIFDPFFSTKVQDGSGTGLGLANVSQIVKGHEGRIWVESKIGVGSTFKIVLPSTKSDSSAKLEVVLGSESIAKPEVSSFRVLYAEDDLDIKELHCELFLGVFGEVISAENGQQALEIITSHQPGYFDLIISDLRMPVMDGLTLYRELRQRNDLTPFIFTTGEIGFGDTLDYKAPNSFVQVVAKPFRLEELIRAVNKIHS